MITKVGTSIDEFSNLLEPNGLLVIALTLIRGLVRHFAGALLTQMLYRLLLYETERLN